MKSLVQQRRKESVSQRSRSLFKSLRKRVKLTANEKFAVVSFLILKSNSLNPLTLNCDGNPLKPFDINLANFNFANIFNQTFLSPMNVFQPLVPDSPKCYESFNNTGQPSFEFVVTE